MKNLDRMAYGLCMTLDGLIIFLSLGTAYPHFGLDKARENSRKSVARAKAIKHNGGTNEGT